MPCHKLHNPLERSVGSYVGLKFQSVLSLAAIPCHSKSITKLETAWPLAGTFLFDPLPSLPSSLYPLISLRRKSTASETHYSVPVLSETSCLVVFVTSISAGRHRSSRVCAELSGKRANARWRILSPKVAQSPKGDKNEAESTLSQPSPRCVVARLVWRVGATRLSATAFVRSAVNADTIRRMSHAASTNQSPTAIGYSLASSSSHGSGSGYGSGNDHPILGRHEPPLPVIQSLLEYFGPHASQLGFFLHAGNFRTSAMLPLPLGDPHRPSPALLASVYLMGAHLSRSPELVALEPMLFQRARQQLSGSDAGNAMHTLQAHVLLTTYLLRMKRFLEAEFHANGAATLAMVYNLHRIRSARGSGSGGGGGGGALPPSQTPVEEGERIRGFWTVACLQSGVNLIVGAESSALSILETASTEIDTAWPAEMQEYERANAGADVFHASQETVARFLREEVPPAGSRSPSTMYAQAMVLLHRASRLGSKWSPDLRSEALSTYIASYTWLDSRIDTFWRSLPAVRPNDASTRTGILVHTIAAGASIALHRTLSASSSARAAEADAAAKCLFAARSIVSVCHGHGSSDDVEVVHPLLGTLLALALRTFVDAILRQRKVARRAGSAEEQGLVADLHRGIEVMRRYALNDQLIEHQLAQVQQHATKAGLTL
ncbi:Zn(2)-C6 fungal-type domain-containing protein [Mycena kentingensis (nom. inval.)]|nr:Zn(2)-C6 fungal-type domain-containing protein [Mycena kentingensis (nom. inval.)]